jgi:hypothetical protein
MSLLLYDKVSVTKDSEGDQKLTLHFHSFNTGPQLDNQDAHTFTVTPQEWFKMRNSVNKLLGE